jgi:glutathione S-transferase
MPSITLYGPRGGSSFRPHWMLAELGLAYEAKEVEMSKGAHKSPEYLAINPAGQVPAMVYDGFVLTESAAMVHYLAEKHDPSFFGPSTPESHATLLRWELYVLLNIDKHLTTHALKAWGMQVDEEALTKANEALARALPVFEGWLKTHAYVTGEDFTVADIVTRTSFTYAEAGNVDLSAYPSIVDWMARCAERPAYAKAKQG